MKMNLQDVLELSSIANKLSKESTDFKTAYKLTKIFNIVSNETEFFQNKLSEIILLYSVKDENGQPVMADTGNFAYSIQEDKLTECEQKLQELSSLEVDIPEITFTLDEFEGVQCTPTDLKILSRFIED